ncbi:MAG: o-succinylbenzoate synthase [Barnesiella sp.]|nr:o-succinylbenzoate synthase [Barnesiella sp.]
MLKATWCSYNLHFKQPATTSRETMTDRPTYYIKVWDDSDPSRFGIGECALFRGLSSDDVESYEDRLDRLCRSIDQFSVNETIRMLRGYPSILFGYESAMADYQHDGIGILSDNYWTSGSQPLHINGLVWMGNFEEMLQRVDEKLRDGFRCIKFKIGGIDFNKEIEMIRQVRKCYSKDQIEIRLDANGGFYPKDALHRLEQLSMFDIHSIEQPIRQRQWHEMSEICKNSPIPIALDEELIGVNESYHDRLIEEIMPDYIILKPTLCGGFTGSDHWIHTAEKYGVGWWATSALESNIGLNAIAQWVAGKHPKMVQGLGTGALFTNNIPSPIVQDGERLFYDDRKGWDYSAIKWIN